MSAWRRHFLVFLLSLAVTGCQQAPPSSIVFAIATAPASLHPLLATDAVSERINELLYRPLVEYGPQGEPVPGVVRWRMRDARHYLLFLAASPAVFSDGSPIVLEDVRQTLLTARDHPASPHASTLRNIREIRLEGEHLVLGLRNPAPRLPEKLHLGVAPAAYLQDDRRLARQPMGSGPFVLQGWNEDGGVRLQRRRDGLLVRFSVVPDPTMRALKLLRGEANLVQNDLPYEMYPLLQDSAAIELAEVPGTTFSYLGFNLLDPLTGDRRLRAAIAHAIDREAIVRHLFMGHARPGNTLLAPGNWATHPALPAYEHDPARARSLLKAMGYGPDKPLRLSFKTSTDPFRVRVASVLQAQLKAVGIELEINSNEWGTFFGDIKAGRFQMYSLSWVGVRSTDIFRHVFHGESLPPGGANRGRYHSPTLDRLIDRSGRLSAQQARPLYLEIQEQLHRDLVYVPLWHENNLLLARDVLGAAPQEDGSYRFLEQVSLRND